MFRYVLPLSLIVGCQSDQEIKTITRTETVPVTNTVTVEIPAEDTDTTPAPETADTGTIPEPLDCGWMVPSNGAFGPDVYVESIPTFTLVDATTTDPITHYQGEDAVFTFAVEASPCGAIELLNFFIVVQDVDGNSWLYDVYQNGTGGVLENLDTNYVYNEVIARNMAITPSGDELHYEWCQNGYGSAVCEGILNLLVISAGDQDLFEFRFTSTHLTPRGEDYEIFVPWVAWRDLTTGQVVTSYNTYSDLIRPVHCEQ